MKKEQNKNLRILFSYGYGLILSCIIFCMSILYGSMQISLLGIIINIGIGLFLGFLIDKRKQRENDNIIFEKDELNKLDK